MRSHSKLLGGILLVAGTTIGAGMLALPVSTGRAGFFPSLMLFLVYWIYMTYTAFLMLEVNLWMGPEANLISMAKKTLGRLGESLSWVIYLFLLYALTTAYIAGGGPIVADVIADLTGYTLPTWFTPLPLLLIFGFFVYKGTRSVDYVNRLLMLGLVLTFGAMVVFLAPHVQLPLLMHSESKYLMLAVSIVATSFGFHIIIPSLTTYFDRDVAQLKKAILIGSAIPLVVYIIWEMLTLGIIPLNGPNGIIEGYARGENGAHLLSEMLGHTTLAFVARGFSFFSIVTSFLGVSLSLSHFLADGFKVKKSQTGRLLLFAMTFVPPLIIVFIDPRAFLNALEFAGAFGVVTLLGLFPALMVWRGRYHKHFQSTFKVPGGKIALCIVIVLSILVIGLEIVNKTELVIR